MCAYYKMFFISVLFFYVKWWWWCQLVYTILSQIKWRVRFFSNNEKSLLIYLQLFLNYYKSSRTGGVIGWSSKIQWYYKKCGQLFIMIIFQKKKIIFKSSKKSLQYQAWHSRFFKMQKIFAPCPEFSYSYPTDFFLHTICSSQFFLNLFCWCFWFVGCLCEKRKLSIILQIWD